MSTDPEQTDQQTFARRAAVAIMCALAVGVLAIAATGQDQDGLVQQAVAAPTADDREGYFPAQFPTPQGMPEAHIEAF
jgi:hypothetical protein